MIHRAFEDLVRKIADAIEPDWDFKAETLEALTAEDFSSICDAAAELLESQQYEVNERIVAEKRALERDEQNSHFEIPQEIRDILADNRGERVGTEPWPFPPIRTKTM